MHAWNPAQNGHVVGCICWDPQTSLSPGQRATIELKLLVIRGSLDDALERAIRQRESLK